MHQSTYLVKARVTQHTCAHLRCITRYTPCRHTQYTGSSNSKQRYGSMDVAWTQPAYAPFRCQEARRTVSSRLGEECRLQLHINTSGMRKCTLSTLLHAASWSQRGVICAFLCTQVGRYNTGVCGSLPADMPVNGARNRVLHR